MAKQQQLYPNNIVLHSTSDDVKNISRIKIYYVNSGSSSAKLKLDNSRTCDYNTYTHNLWNCMDICTGISIHFSWKYSYNITNSKVEKIDI